MGGGALFAVTGGLAAPAIAAGMGSILGFIGAPTAVAGTITGFLGSTVGAATVTTTMAGAGAASTGSKMAYRTAGVSEFGFRELLPLAAQALPAAAQEQLDGAAAGAAAAAEAADGDQGHLQIGLQPCGGYQSARAVALRKASSASSMASAFSGSSGALQSVSSDSLQQQQQGGVAAASAGAQEDPLSQPSVWQRWFGSGGVQQVEEVLLAVPMRVK